MMPGRLSRRVAAERLAWIDAMLAEIRALPLDDRAAFLHDRRHRWAAESCLRRALEALFDLGRHILAEGFGDSPSEYKAVAAGLGARGVLSNEASSRLQVLGSYRNRMVNFYHEITADELYDLCAHHLDDVTSAAEALRAWLAEHQDELPDLT